MVELIVPSLQSANAEARAAPSGAGFTGESQATAAAEDWVPTYSARQTAGERVVQFAPTSDGSASR